MNNPLKIFLLSVMLIGIFWIGAVMSGCSFIPAINNECPYCNTIEDCPIVVCSKCPDPYNETWQNEIMNECVTDCETTMNRSN